LSEQQYRTVKKNLTKWGFVGFKKAGRLTDQGTVAILLNSDVYDINDSEANGRPTEDQRKTNGRPTEDQRQTKKERKEEVEEGKKKPTSPPADFSVFCATDHQVDEVKRIRRLNKGGAMSQRVVDTLAKEFQQAGAMGYTLDELLTEWEYRGWKSFKAEWIKPKALSNGTSQKDQKRQEFIEQRNRELGITPPPPNQGDFIDGEVIR
jgi:hypothetical protein